MCFFISHMRFVSFHISKNNNQLFRNTLRMRYDTFFSVLVRLRSLRCRSVKRSSTLAGTDRCDSSTRRNECSTLNPGYLCQRWVSYINIDPRPMFPHIIYYRHNFLFLLHFTWTHFLLFFIIFSNIGKKFILIYTHLFLLKKIQCVYFFHFFTSVKVSSLFTLIKYI